MNSMVRKDNAFVLLILLAMAVHFYFGWTAIQSFSATYDEPYHLTSGYAVLKKGNYLFDDYQNPPLAQAWAALPLLVMNPILPVHHTAWISRQWNRINEYRFADAFIYKNRISHEKLLSSGRIMQLILSLVFIVGMSLVGWKLAGQFGAVVGAGTMALSVSWLAHATLITTDLAFAGFFFLFFGSLLWKGNGKTILVSGLLLGACLLSKHFALGFVPCFVALAAWDLIRNPSESWGKRFSHTFNRERLWKGALIVSIASVLILLTYRLTAVDVFLTGLKQMVTRSQMERSSFLWGEYSVKGWPHYFLVAFILKTSLPLLIAGVGSGIILVWKKKSVPAVIWIPPLVFFALASFSKVQIGHRYILAIYPFLFAVVVVALHQLTGPARNGAVALFFGASLMVLITTSPNYLSHFNVLVGGSENGYRYLTDSNVDWGQGLKMLSKKLTDQDKKDGIYLCYFGVADPQAYGIAYVNVGIDPITGRPASSAPDLRPQKFVISATSLQSTYYADRSLFKWLEGYLPIDQIADSLFVYDFSNNPDAIDKLEQMRINL